MIGESSRKFHGKKSPFHREKNFRGVTNGPAKELFRKFAKGPGFSAEKSMTDLTTEKLAAAVASLPTVFDSHDVIRVIMTNNPQEYVRELYEWKDADDPIQAAHADIGESIRAVEGVVPTCKVDSMNIRGRVTKNQQWRKL
jgi:hypothetical protein